jgi:hypothetical protein
VIPHGLQGVIGVRSRLRGYQDKPAHQISGGSRTIPAVVSGVHLGLRSASFDPSLGDGGFVWHVNVP